MLENVYLGWFKLNGEGRLLYLSNGQECSCYCFQDDSFYNDHQQLMALATLQLDFESRFEGLQELGKGAYSTVTLPPSRSSKSDAKSQDKS